MRPEHQIEPQLPALAPVGGSESRFAHATVHWLPNTANVALSSRGRAIDACENHRVVLQRAFDNEELASIGDPALMPELSRGIVDTEALSFVAVNALIIFVDNAAVKDAVDADSGISRGGAEVKGVPITDPEIEFMIGGRRACPGCWRLRASGNLEGQGFRYQKKDKQGEQSEHKALSAGVPHVDLIRISLSRKATTGNTTP